jgi:hypothetical protein
MQENLFQRQHVFDWMIDSHLMSYWSGYLIGVNILWEELRMSHDLMMVND